MNEKIEAKQPQDMTRNELLTARLEEAMRCQEYRKRCDELETKVAELEKQVAEDNEDLSRAEAEMAAQMFHLLYEELAPLYSWQLDTRCAGKPWVDLPPEKRGATIESFQRLLAWLRKGGAIADLECRAAIDEKEAGK